MPSTFTTGYRYAGLGYTTAFDAAVAPLVARHSHSELDDTPCVDGGIFALMGNDEYLLRQIEAGERERARDYAAWLLGATGGVRGQDRESRRRRGLEDRAAQRDAGWTRRSTAAASRRAPILETLTDAANALRLPHPVHIHCNNLGVAGQRGRPRWRAWRALAGRRAHFTHLQFHCYGGGPRPAVELGRGAR